MDIGGWISGFFGQIGDLLLSLLNTILSVLPNSPFVYMSMDETIYKYLRYINYFLPIDFAVSVLEAWIIAVGIFYLWQVLLRYIKAIE